MQSFRSTQLNNPVQRSTRCRCGEALAIIVTAVAATSLVVTSVTTGQSAGNVLTGVFTEKALLENANQVSRQLGQLMELKLQREHERGEISRTEWESALAQLHARQGEDVMRGVAHDLYLQQSRMTWNALLDFTWNTALNFALIEAGLRWDEQRAIGRDVSKWKNFFADVFSLGVTGTQSALELSPQTLLNQQQFLQALDQAEAQLRSGSTSAQARSEVRVRVHRFFDLWHMRNIATVTPELFFDNLKQFKIRCDGDLEQYVSQELIKEGWVIEPEGLTAFASVCLKDYRFYKETFEPGIEGTFALYLRDAETGATKPLTIPGGESHGPIRLRCSPEGDQGKLVCRIDLALPAETKNLAARMGVKIPASLSFPIDLREAEGRMYYYNEGDAARQALRTATSIAGIFVGGVASIFDERLPQIESQPHNARIVITPSEDGGILAKVTFDCTITIRGDETRQERMKGVQYLIGRRLVQ